MKQACWRTNDGRTMGIDKMKSSHIENCIATIKRGHDAEGRRVTWRTKALLPALELELVIRAEGLRK